MNRPHAATLFLAAAPLALVGCASMTRSEVRWEPVVVHQGDAAFERLKTGRPDPRDPNLQIVGVDQGGHLVLVHWNGGVAPRSEVIYENRAEMTGLAVGHVDPSVTGEEIYAGAYEPGQDDVGGWVLQAVITPEGTKIRRIFTAGSYVHSVEILPPTAPGVPTRLVASTYAGEIHVLTPAAGDGPWEDRLVYRNPPIADPQPKDPRPRIKDVALLRDASGRPSHEVFAVFAGGRAVYVDLDRPESARVVTEEDGGWGRTCPDEGTGAYACGYKGRVIRFTRDAANEFKQEVLDQEGIDSGLRGVVMGRFPLPGSGGEVAPLAIFGFHTLCRALVRRNGAWDPVTLYRDVDRGHTMIAADLVAGNDADELVMSGYSKRITVLVARR